MSVSYPSKPVMAVETPDVSFFDTSFVYNFFVADERVNDSGTAPETFLNKASDSFDNVSNDALAKIPRFVRFRWSQVNVDENYNKNAQPLLRLKSSGLSRQNQSLIKSNFGKIYKEEEFTNFGFSGIEFQDTGVDGKLNLIVSGTVSKFVNSNNIQVGRTVNKQIEFVAGKIDTNRVSSLDVAKFLAGDLDAQDLPNQVIIDALTDLRSAGVRFYDETAEKELIEQNFERLKDVKTRYRVNNKFIKTILNSSATDPLGFFADEVGPMLSEADSIQNEQVQQYNPESISEAEYDVVVDPIAFRSAPKDTAFLPVRKHVGYIIEKYKRNSDGTLVEAEPIILESETTTSTIDFRVAYGSVYVYQIRAVYLIEFQTYTDEDDEILISTILVASAPSKRSVLVAEETIAPPPPSDADVVWDAKEQSPVVMWSFPVNPQRDIKKWQIFRRDTINDPFELLVQLDFDNSVVPTVSYEKVDINLIKKLSSPQNYWVDKNFDKNKKYIYTVASVDAHGLTSNYGIQFEIGFDRAKNKITKKLISSSGAPKQYPNMFLNADTFVDVIRDSNHKKMTIFFDPEYLEVIRTGAQPEPFIGTVQNNSSYKLQMVNVDFQQSQLLDIFVEDLRGIKQADVFQANKTPKIFRHKAYRQIRNK